MMDGNREVLNLNISHSELGTLFHNPELVGDVEEYCAIPAAPDADVLDSLPCSAGHTAAYVSPYGDVYPCVQFPLPTGNVREKKFLDIWRYSPEMNEVRSITLRDLTNCSKCSNLVSCTRCPGLAYMEGNMRGSSTQDCEKSLVRTGVMSENLKARKNKPLAGLIQIQGLSAAMA
jgi:radical SAM protein with 4Fe4S-binding SPASM domain